MKKRHKSTEIKHREIYDRFIEITTSCRENGTYNKIYLASFFAQISEETGFTEGYIAKIVNKQQKERR